MHSQSSTCFEAQSAGRQEFIVHPLCVFHGIYSTSADDFSVFLTQEHWHTRAPEERFLRHTSWAQMQHCALIYSLVIHLPYQIWSPRVFISCCNILVKWANLYPCVFSVKRVYVCVQVCGCTFGCVRSCALSRCAGMAVCCNASCFANCRRSKEGHDICRRGCWVEKKVDKDTVASTKSKTMSHLTGLSGVLFNVVPGEYLAYRMLHQYPYIV